MPMKFRAHDTFFIRKGWLSKGMRCVFNNPVVFISRDENPMDVLGLGANMVKALVQSDYCFAGSDGPLDLGTGKKTNSYGSAKEALLREDMIYNVLL